MNITAGSSSMRSSVIPRIGSSRVLLVAVLLAMPGPALPAAMPPNILILLGDDIDRDSLGPWGGQAQTPHLNQLAAEGIRLDRVYANVAMCAPFRQEFFSGRCAWRTRALPNHSRSRADTRSLPHFLRPLGYRVSLLGKKHIGPPAAYPFDDVGDLPKRENPNPKALRLAQRAIRDAREAAVPFCLVVASHDAHGPSTHGNRSRYDPASLQLPADTIDTPEYRAELAEHLAEVTNLDSLLGALRSVLRAEQVDQNTLVLFCSEQGNCLPFSKWTCFDDGLASGVIAALPGTIPAGSHSSQMVWIADIAPTLVAAAGGQPADCDCDGLSQWQNWTGGNETLHRYAYGAFSNCNIIDNRHRIYPIRSIRDNRYTLIWSPRADTGITSNTTLTQALRLIDGKQLQAPANTAASWVLAARRTASLPDNSLVDRLHHRPEWAVYDREHDPEELDNLADRPAYRPIRERLQQALFAWLNRWDDADPVATEQQFAAGKSP